MQYQATRCNRRTVSRGGAHDDEAAPEVTEDSRLVKLELGADAVLAKLDPARTSGHSPKPATMTSSQVGYKLHGENASGKPNLTCLWYLLR